MSVLDTIKSRKLLKGIALDVYEIITRFPNLTAGEIAKKYEAHRPKLKRGRNEIAKRVRDLEVWGAVKKTGTAVCDVTGKNVATYAVTGNIPVRTGNVPKSITISTNKAKQVEATAMKTLATAQVLDERVGVLLAAVAGGEIHFQTLRKIQAEKVKKIRSFLTGGARKAELRKELDAIEYILSTASYVKDFGGVA